MNTVKLSVEAKNLVNTLKVKFANYDSVIKELAQNARRAGATEVHFIIDSELATLSVIDNGRGIHDMGAILSVDSSVSKDASRDDERTRSLGVLAAVYTAGHIEITSLDKRISASTDKILSMDSIQVDPITFVPSTTIKLSGGGVTALLRSIQADIRGLRSFFTNTFRAFPINVYVNDWEITRDRSIDSGIAWVELSEGLFHVPMSVSRSNRGAGSLRVESRWVAYYHGLEIHRCGYDHKSHPINVVHLDGDTWGELDNVDESRNKIVGLIERVIESNLCNFAYNPENEAIVLNSYNLYANYDLLQVYNAMDSLPANVLCCQASYPVITNNGENEFWIDTFISKSDVQSGSVFVFEEAPIYDEGCCFSYPMYLFALRDKAYWLGAQLHSDHWIYSHCIRERSESGGVIEVEVFGLRELNVSTENSALSITPAMVDSYILRGPAGDVIITDLAMAVAGGFIVEGLTRVDHVVLIPHGSSENKTLLQVNSYSWDDEFHNEAYELDAKRFLAWLALERIGLEPEKLFRKLLDAIGTSYPQLNGKQFTVSFSDSNENRISVNVC